MLCDRPSQSNRNHLLKSCLSMRLLILLHPLLVTFLPKIIIGRKRKICNSFSENQNLIRNRESQLNYIQFRSDCNWSSLIIVISNQISFSCKWKSVRSQLKIAKFRNRSSTKIKLNHH